MKKALNTTLDEDVIAKIRKRKGLRSMSSAVQSLLERALLGQDASFLPPPLRDCQVTHSATRNSASKVWFLDSSQVIPKDDAPGGSMPYSVLHDRQLKGRADEVKPSKHWFDPTRCEFCRYVLRDFSG